MGLDIIRSETAWDEVRKAGLALRIQTSLQSLAEIEASFWEDRQSLLEWAGPEALKERFLGQLERHHAQEKDLIVRRVDALRQDFALMSEDYSLRQRN
jgi:hypothetical protein